MNINDIGKNSFIIMDGEPYEVLDIHVFRMQQRKPVAQTKIKNLINGKVLSKTFHQNDTLEEAGVEKIKSKFIYSHRDEYWFCDEKDTSKRFKLNREVLSDATLFLKPGTIIESIKFDDRIINIKLPIKMDLMVVEAPPSIRGNTAQGGTKTVVLETGAKIAAPLFIEEGDIIRVNTETAAYAERVEKGK